MENYEPYSNASMNQIYNLLFCDQPERFRSAAGEDLVFPWDVLLAPDADVASLRKIAADADAESRVRILAFNRLVSEGQRPDSMELLGVIVEVGMEEGLDVLAAFADGTARYINYSEKLIVWEGTSAVSAQLIGELFQKSREVVQKIGKWDQPRLSFPAAGDVRLTFLTADGLYFGEGPFDVLAEDAMGGPVIGAGAELMSFITENA